jgi:multidrug efflux pump subunit AcrB
VNLAKFSLARKKLTYFGAILLALSGVLSYLEMGWLEDPDFSVKVAAITVDYPGATPEEVEQEIVEVIETKLQEMPQLKHLYSLSRDGRAIIKAEIKDEYWSPELPQVWDELRRKIRDIQPWLPEGAREPMVRDDYGFVFGFVIGITSDGYDYHELKDYVKNIRRELSLMTDIARIDYWGVQQRQVFIDLSTSEASEIGLSMQGLAQALQSQSLVVDAGLAEVGKQQYSLQVSGEAKNLQDISNILVASTNNQGKSQLVRLGDIAHLSYGYQTPPATLMRSNGKPALALAIAPTQGSNVVTVGRKLEKRLAELQQDLPLGIEIQKVAWQSDYVAQGVNTFMVSLVEAITIVFLVISITMGLRMGLIIGAAGLGLTVLGSLTLMNALHIDLHRVSLGALVVAMGMMVDNAIVVADGFVVRVRQGMSRLKAAEEAASLPSIPLLGATLVAVMAFYPIAASNDSSGEYSSALFFVVGLSLFLSWVVSQTVIPLLCVYWIKVDPNSSNQATSSGIIEKFRQFLVVAIRRRVAFLMATLAALFIAFGSAPWMPVEFFPEAVRNQFMVDYWAPEGTQLLTVAEDVEALEQEVMGYESVDNVSSFFGQGPPRFYLPVDPELPNPSYAQILVTTESAKQVNKIAERLSGWIDENQPQALIRVRKFGVGSAETWPVKIRIIGPAHAELDTLRDIELQVAGILKDHANIPLVTSDWRQRNMQIEAQYSLQEGGWIGVSREDVASAAKQTLDGEIIGSIREQDETYPVVVRVDETTRTSRMLDQIQVRQNSSAVAVPMGQVNKQTLYNWYDPIIWRYDRRRTISVLATTQGKATLKVYEDIIPPLEQIKMPAGYSLELGGEYESSGDARASLLPGLPVALCVMTLVVVGLFNAFRPPLIIFAVVPFALIGIIFGHIITGIPLGFISILGAFSLSGMMIKNAVVLLDQVNLNLKAGMGRYESLVDAAQSRLLPVVNASLTTILGMIPLLQDVFWQSISVTIMSGLLVGTAATMLLLPVLYVVAYRVEEPLVAER